MRWEANVARTHGEMRNAHKILVGNSEGKRPLGNLGLNGMIILRWI
jgi:hypothetical protein